MYGESFFTFKDDQFQTKCNQYCKKLKLLNVNLQLTQLQITHKSLIAVAVVHNFVFNFFISMHLSFSIENYLTNNVNVSKICIGLYGSFKCNNRMVNLNYDSMLFAA